MFLHLGADTIIPLDHVIAIHDMKEMKSAINHEFLKNMKEEKRIIDVSDNHCKSFIVTEKFVYLSAISSFTLKKRAENLPFDEE